MTEGKIHIKVKTKGCENLCNKIFTAFNFIIIMATVTLTRALPILHLECSHKLKTLEFTGLVTRSFYFTSQQ